MRYVNIDDVEAGQFLGKAVYSGNGTVLLSAGVQLTVYMVNTLNRIGVTMLYIQDPLFEDVEAEDILQEATKQTLIHGISDTFEAVRSGKEWNAQKIGTSVEKLLTDIIDNKDLLIELTEIRTVDNDQYVHAMNVCLISTVMGINLGLNYIQAKELAIGALLHDIGKTGLSAEEEIIPGVKNHHTWRGFEKLKNKREFNLLIAHVALQHHERVDGLGIPRGLAGEEIHIYAKIVAVANMYDHLISHLEGGKSLLPHEACEEMMAMSEQQLDREVLIQFTRMVSVYPNGSAVRLSTKETGVVVSQHRGLPGRPVVRIIRNEGNDIDIKEIDLAQETTIFIEGVLA
ncbi:HD-GYP domain-containing protein [Paenibacillus crassostreae]|uniref:Metal-dependent phosphohydrolase n=1 Tax=Paenibacillus crassostreae TaxID=1763538 RepID=A0A162N785_9BACL|nr:HD domain-containing phosphohydrolase [Paenibacillus crassostreae]AOZ92347.1 metal-dependent phosphohydrolase [Paenibacillus crassostreae]OAB71062.1 metal-dependent phosphohydrolase [Paenibacillus crassostreae]